MSRHSKRLKGGDLMCIILIVLCVISSAIAQNTLEELVKRSKQRKESIHLTEPSILFQKRPVDTVKSRLPMLDTTGHGRTFLFPPQRMIQRREFDSIIVGLNSKIDKLVYVGTSLQDQTDEKSRIDYWMKFLNAPGMIALIGLIAVLLKRRKE